ncbi:MAG: methyltransferase domain-containing protein [Candidatus Thorarchaeota archaeon]|nr:methyltransferase domain-containing protein [Candidatus Thorarchaeota archaeon]
MKLNIGCGLVYRKGYVNIDAYDNTVADRKMSAMSLGFDNDTFTQVDCIHVLEHLGAAKSIYALSEIYRVLKPNGIFLLETPDLVNSFKSFVKGKEKDRKLLMNWIYGLDSPGMSHRYGFPRVLMKRMLEETGFTDLEIKNVNPKSVHPSIRVTCRKLESAVYQTISEFRRKLVEEKAVDLDNQVETIEKEGLIRGLIELTLGADSMLDDSYLTKMLESSAVVAPKVGEFFLNCLYNNKLLSSTRVNEFRGILEKLDSVNFAKVLTLLFYKMPVNPGFQDESFDTVVKVAGQLIRKVIRGEAEALSKIENIAEKTDDVGHIGYFSKTALEILSNEKVALGLKAFGLDRLDESARLFQDAVKLNHDSIISFWNLARLNVLKRNDEKMAQNYAAVWKILELKYPRRHQIYTKKLEEEQRLAALGKHSIFSEPIYSL